MFHKLHTTLVTAYLIAGLALMATTPWLDVRGQLLNSGGATLMEMSHDQNNDVLHGAAKDGMDLSEEALMASRRANAGRQLVLGVLLFTLGGFMHAYGRVRNERPVRVTVKKKHSPRTLFWVQMNV